MKQQNDLGNLFPTFTLNNYYVTLINVMVISGARVMREEGETAERGGGVDERSVQGFPLGHYKNTIVKVF